MLGLVRARKYLQNRFGTAHLNFGEPISLADELGDRRQRFLSPTSEAELEEKLQEIGRLWSTGDRRAARRISLESGILFEMLNSLFLPLSGITGIWHSFRDADSLFRKWSIMLPAPRRK
jgi:hypothetical protein